MKLAVQAYTLDEQKNVIPQLYSSFHESINSREVTAIYIQFYSTRRLQRGIGMSYTIQPILSMNIFKKCNQEERREMVYNMSDYLIKDEEDQIYYSQDQNELASNDESKISLKLHDILNEIKVQEINYQMEDERGQMTQGNKCKSEQNQGFENDYEFEQEEERASINDDNYEVETSFQEKKNVWSKRSANRKTRTTITQQKLDEMNRLFVQFYNNRDRKPPAEINLQKIAKKLGLGYSTILHKFKQFKENKEVKGGFLLELGQQKRRYKKSLKIEEYIIEALNNEHLANAVEISKYIYRTKKEYYSRAVICRHLMSMNDREGNSKQIKVNPDLQPLQQHSTKSAVQKVIQSQIAKGNVIFCNETVFSTRPLTNLVRSCEHIVRFNKGKTRDCFCITTLVAIHGGEILHFKVKRGLLSRQQYANELEHIGTKVQQSCPNSLSKKILATNINQIHYNKIPDYIEDTKEDGLSEVLRKYRLIKVVLPEEYMIPSIFAQLHNYIGDKLNSEILNRQHMKKIVESIIKNWTIKDKN